MISIFATPKAFGGHIDDIQRNAIKSWTLLPDAEVVLLGDDPGTAQAAQDLGVRHVPDILRNEFGTPLVSSLIGTAESSASGDLLAYVNADILLMGDFTAAIQKVAARWATPFLMVGQRWNIDVDGRLAFTEGWQDRLRHLTKERGELSPPPWIDYFVFRRDLWRSIPPFAIGRTVWDNWLIYRARALGRPVIDATEVVTAIHQNHDYAHVPKAAGGAWKGPEADRNLALAGGLAHTFWVTDATHRLTEKGIKPKWGLTHWRHNMHRVPVLYPWLTPVVRTLEAAIGLTRPARLGMKKFTGARRSSQP